MSTLTRTGRTATKGSQFRIVVVLVAFVAFWGTVSVLAALGYLSSDDAFHRTLWVELARAGLSVLVVAVAGGFVTFEWNGLASRREHERAELARATAREREEGRRRIERLDAQHREIVGLYNEVKSIRRALRALGLDPKLAKEVTSLTAVQIEGFRRCMADLSRVQLGFEAKKREFRQLHDSGRATSEQAAILKRVESWLNDIVDVWEVQSASLYAPSDRTPDALDGRVDPETVTSILEGLDALMRSESLKSNVTRPLEALMASLYDALLEAEPAGGRPVVAD